MLQPVSLQENKVSSTIISTHAVPRVGMVLAVSGAPKWIWLAWVDSGAA